MWEYLELTAEVEPKSQKPMQKARFYCPDEPWKVAQVRWFTDRDTAVLRLLREKYEPLGPVAGEEAEARETLAFRRKIWGT